MTKLRTGLGLRLLRSRTLLGTWTDEAFADMIAGIEDEAGRAIDGLREALEKIDQQEGISCSFESLCSHAGCHSSRRAQQIAHAALGVTSE